MADFHQSNSITSLHRLRPERFGALESELLKNSRHTALSLILPALICEFERPAMDAILRELREVRYFNRIVVAIGKATRDQVEDAASRFRGFRSPVTILWMEDPRIQEILRTLETSELTAAPEGKGKTCWLSMGYLLADKESDVIALHDCDIVNYSREIPAALCYPLAHPQLKFDFCKGYYARVSDRLHGRVTRLFLAPLLQSLRETAPQSNLLSFLSEFRYPLAGEFAMKASLARKVNLPGNWGLEVGMLSQALRHAGSARTCQADIADNYEHKHQDLSPNDPSKGLRRMTLDIARTLLCCLADEGIRLNPASRERLAPDYMRCAARKLVQYEADAIMNGLRYDRQEEVRAIESFARSVQESANSLHDPMSPREGLPAWSRVQETLPGLTESLLRCEFETRSTHTPRRYASINISHRFPILHL